ncbi:MAG: recombination mediator RecR [Parcubacteria group bacterium]
MSVLPQPVIELIESFARLPGIGPKRASRLAFYLLKADQSDLDRFAQQVSQLKKMTVRCRMCQAIATSSPCETCKDPARDASKLCVLEDTLDLVALERSGRYRGRYHVLGGVLSPIDGIGPEQLSLPALTQRLKTEPLTEVIIATNPTVEGEATALYVTKIIRQNSKAKVTRLAHGLPVGADLEYADEVTLGRALDGRLEVDNL